MKLSDRLQLYVTALWPPSTAVTRWQLMENMWVMEFKFGSDFRGDRVITPFQF